MKYKPREAFASQANAISDLQEGSKQFARMAVYWGTVCNSLQAQINALIRERNEKSFVVELLEVTNVDMEQMRQHLVTGIPTFFSIYPDGVTKLYPIPEHS